MSKYCYWSVADSEHGHDKMAAAMIQSARAADIKENFHIWSDVPVAGAITHDSGRFTKDHYLFKFDFLLEAKKLLYDYFIFIDADSWFVRNPGDVLKYCHNSPVHICMESNCDDPDAYREDWWGCPLPRYCELMREKGVRCKQVFNMNAGFWIVHRHAIDHVVRLGREFWHYANDKGFPFTEEAPLAYVGHMMMGNPYKHQLKMNPELWASDWLGHFKDRIPVDEQWDFHDYMTDEIIKVRPAIVHAMRSKKQLIEVGKTIT